MRGPEAGHGEHASAPCLPESPDGTWRRRLLLIGLLLIGIWALVSAATGRARADEVEPTATQQASIISPSSPAVGRDAAHRGSPESSSRPDAAGAPSQRPVAGEKVPDPPAAGETTLDPSVVDPSVVDPSVDPSVDPPALDPPVDETPSDVAPVGASAASSPAKPAAAAPPASELPVVAVPESPVPVPDSTPTVAQEDSLADDGDLGPGTASAAARVPTLGDPPPTPAPGSSLAERPTDASIARGAAVVGSSEVAVSADDCAPLAQQVAVARGVGTGITVRPAVSEDGDETVRPAALSRTGHTPWHAPFDLPLPVPVPVPAPAPVAPGGAGCASASASSGSAGHSGDQFHALAVHDARLAASIAGSAARPASGPAGYPGGGADDPGTRPD